MKFNRVLQVDTVPDIQEGSIFNFQKHGNRIFPLDTPIDLINVDREAIAKIVIRSFTNQTGLTSGKYEIIKPYSGKEKETLTEYWIANA